MDNSNNIRGHQTSKLGENPLSIIINQHNNDSQVFEKLKDIAIVAFLKYDFILFLGAEGICVQLVGSFSYHGSFSYAMKCLNGVM